MKRLFINYRIADTGPTAKHLAADLRGRFPQHRIFLDSSSLEPGKEFPKQLSEELEQADVVLALIGKTWLKSHDDNTGQRRLDNPHDWVRRELEIALARRNKGRVELVPLLVDNATMPALQALPKTIAVLANLQAEPLRNDNDWEHDVDGLSEFLVRHGFQRAADSAVHEGKSGDSVPSDHQAELDDLRMKLESEEACKEMPWQRMSIIFVRCTQVMCFYPMVAVPVAYMVSLHAIDQLSAMTCAVAGVVVLWLTHCVVIRMKARLLSLRVLCFFNEVES